MENVLVTTVIHVLTAVFWAGTTFGLARTSGASAERLFAPQMGAAAIAMLSGAYLWKLTHAGGAGPAEQALIVGAVCAIAAAGVQGVLVGPVLRMLRTTAGGDAMPQKRVALAYRISAALLAVTILTMVGARYL